MPLPERSDISHYISAQLIGREKTKSSQTLQNWQGDWKADYTGRLRHALAAINPRVFGPTHTSEGEDEI